MAFSFFDHTGDIGVRLSGRTPDDLFQSAADALTDTITDRARIESRRAIGFALESSAVDLLLVDFLAEILYRFEVDRFLVARSDVHLDRPRTAPDNPSAAWRLHATLHGEGFDAARHPIKVLVKAVTYHALEVASDAAGWHATLVFDI